MTTETQITPTRDTLRKLLATSDTARELSNSLSASIHFAFRSASALIFANPHGLTPQAACDSLADDGLLQQLYTEMSTALGVLAQLYPHLLGNFNHTEVISYTDETGTFRLLVTDTPFDLTRPRFPHQTSRAAAESFAETLKPKTI